MNSEWDAVASKWESEIRTGNWFHRYIIYPSIFRMLGPIKEKRVLDIGCGNGHLSALLNTHDAIVVGIDKSEEMIAICNRNYQNILFRPLDITKEYLQNEMFDFGIFNNSLQDIDDFAAALANTRQMLADKGQIIIVVKHPCFHPRREDNGWCLSCDNGDEIVSGHGLTSLLNEQRRYKGKYFLMDDYFNNAPHTRMWFGAATHSYTRTLEEYINTIISAGFRIDNIYEPKPECDGKNEHEDLYDLLLRIPNFLAIKATTI